MTRGYEVVYIFDSTLDETQVDEHLKQFHALLINDDNPDPVKNVNHWGKRTLAYPIKGREIGYYVVVQFATDPTLLGEFERLVKLEEKALRYQLVLNEGKVPALVAPVVDGKDQGAASNGPDTAGSPAPPISKPATTEEADPVTTDQADPVTTDQADPVTTEEANPVTTEEAQ